MLKDWFKLRIREGMDRNSKRYEYMRILGVFWGDWGYKVYKDSFNNKELIDQGARGKPMQGACACHHLWACFLSLSHTHLSTSLYINPKSIISKWSTSRIQERGIRKVQVLWPWRHQKCKIWKDLESDPSIGYASFLWGCCHENSALRRQWKQKRRRRVSNEWTYSEAFILIPIPTMHKAEKMHPPSLS